MCWLKRDLWKVSIALAGLLFFLGLIAWVPVSAAGAYEGASGLATSVTGTVQTTPTEDATVTALNKEKLTQDVAQQQHTWENWFWSSGATLLSTLAVALAGVLGFLRYLRDQRIEREKQREDRQTEREKREQEQQRWLKDQEAEREKRAEERFQSVVEGLGNAREEAKVGAAIMLRTFLQPGYEQFYRQAFDLTVAHLRLQHVNGNRAESHDSFSQALTVAFKESFPLAREQLRDAPTNRQPLDASLRWGEVQKRDTPANRQSVGDRFDSEGFPLLQKRDTPANRQSLDASLVWLDSAYLATSDLSRIWMPGAHLRGANLSGADLSGADLREANLSQVNLSGADLSGADLREANLSQSDLSGTDLSGADLREANLTGVILDEAHLSRAQLTARKRILSPWGGLDVVDLEATDLNLNRADMRGIRGLSREKLVACEQQGAIIDKDTTTSPPPLSVSPSPPSQSHDTQAPSAHRSAPPSGTDGSATSSKPGDSAQPPSAPPVQGSIPPPDTGGSSASPSQQGPEL